jgi:hypothetical protein
MVNIKGQLLLFCPISVLSFTDFVVVRFTKCADIMSKKHIDWGKIFLRNFSEVFFLNNRINSLVLCKAGIATTKKVFLQNRMNNIYLYMTRLEDP